MIFRTGRRPKSNLKVTLTAGRNRTTIAILLVLGLVTAACADEAGTTTTAGDEDQTTVAGDPTTTAVGESPTDEEVSIHVWSSRTFFVPPAEFEPFMAEYPNITVTYDVQANDDILQQLLRMRDAGQPLPDVINDDSFLIQSYQEAGLLLPHNEIVAQFEAEDPELFNLIMPSAWEETTIDGEAYGQSVLANFDVLYYNTAWFEEAGIETPFDSLDEVLDAMRAMKATRPDSIPFTVQAQAGFGVTTLKTVLAAAGAPFDGAVPDLTSEGGIYAIDWFLQASNEGLLPPEAVAWGEDESRGAFVSGDAGLILDGFRVSADFDEVNFTYPDGWSVTPVPISRSGGGVDGVALSSAKTWVVTADTEHPYEAGLVLRYLAETDNLVDGVLEFGSFPMRQSEALNDPRIAEFWPFFDEALKESYLGSSPAPAGPNAGAVEGILEQMFGEIVVGTDLSAEELAANYQPLLDEA